MRGNEINNLPSLPKLDIPWFVLCKVYHYIPNISIKYWVHIVLDPNFTQETSWLVGFEKQKSRIQSIFQTEESISTRKAAFWDLTKNWCVLYKGHTDIHGTPKGGKHSHILISNKLRGFPLSMFILFVVWFLNFKKICVYV